MTFEGFSSADENGIVRVMPRELSEENKRRIKKFETFTAIYDLIQER
jgi:hypothetical protein